MFYVVSVFLLCVTLSGLDNYNRYNTDIWATIHGSKEFERYNDDTGFTSFRIEKLEYAVSELGKLEYAVSELGKQESGRSAAEQHRERVRKQNEKERGEAEEERERVSKQNVMSAMNHFGNKTGAITGKDLAQFLSVVMQN